MIRLALVTALAVTATQASAANWWWVAGDPGEDTITFVDADLVRHEGGAASVRALVVTRAGGVSQIDWRARCDTRPNGTIAEMTRFACASEETRMQDFAMLGTLSPGEAARAIFATKPLPR
jgi:hypothetical protein